MEVIFFRNINEIQDDYPIPYWHGEHLDHWLLTGLCSATYYREDNEIPEPKGAGLYIRNKHLHIPYDCR